MNKDEVLNLTKTEFEAYINTCIPNVTHIDIEPSYVRDEMISELAKLFDDIEVTNILTTGGEASIDLGLINIIVKVSVKGTGNLVTISKLKKKEKKKAGTFKVHSIKIAIQPPLFELVDRKSNLVEISTTSSLMHMCVDLTNRTETFKNMLSKEILMTEFSAQTKYYNNIREGVTLDAAQPLIKIRAFESNWNQEAWDKCLKDTAEANKELIDSVIDKMFTKI